MASFCQRVESRLWLDTDRIARAPVFVKTPDVTEYQVRQTMDGIDVALVAMSPVDTADISERLRMALHEAGLADSQVSVSPVSEIAQSSVGKLRRFVPLA